MTLLDKQTASRGPDVGPRGSTPHRRRAGRRPRTGLPLRGPSGLSLGLVTLWLSLLVLLPLVAVVGKAFDGGWSAFWSTVTGREAWSALQLTILLALGVAVVGAIMGTLVAWVLVRGAFRGSGVLGTVIDIPFALPTIVAGLVMFAVYGPNGLGLTVGHSRTVMFITLLFVTLPFGVRTVQPVMVDLDRDAEQAAASLGASKLVSLRRIVLPQLAPAIASGAALAFARALGEYGSLVFISSNTPYKDEYASAYIYRKLQDADNPAVSTQQAAAIAAVLLLASVIVLILLDLIQRRMARRG
jgi:sulfate/thiosulfate transport system permease protein